PGAGPPRKAKSWADKRTWRPDERSPWSNKRHGSDERARPDQWVDQRPRSHERADERPQSDQRPNQRTGPDERPDERLGSDQRDHERPRPHERAHERVGWSTGGGLPCLWSARDGPEHGMETVPHSARERRAPP